MEAALKKGVVLLVVLFLGFYLFTDPNGAASAAKTGGTHLWDALVSLFKAIISFLHALMS
ncbi:MAG TPA: hypothetical protein VFM09_09665 [Marmoricola sp.]|nr:hypothetical protein [Marmoricola sp.]